jgi:hypothetical protein
LSDHLDAIVGARVALSDDRDANVSSRRFARRRIA